jgi:2-polyprenyl-3-methyl-5-hydroxy-6-metoxy-1,4-benzoquinol methylase
MNVTEAERLAFVAERRAISVQRYNELHSVHYDEQWGEISPAHAQFVSRLIERLSLGAEVLDAACGTGKYWPDLLAAGLIVRGIDQSSGMLAQAARKHPGISTEVRELQSLEAAQAYHASFDGLLCVDALECVPPEHWPGVVRGLASTLRAGGPAWVTIELWPGELPATTDPRQVPGEVTEGGGYHYYPEQSQARQWLNAAGFDMNAEVASEFYWHLLLTHR